MRALRLNAPAPAGTAVMRAPLPRPARVRPVRRRLRTGGIVSAAMHLLAVVLLLMLGKAGSPPELEQDAPTFAVQFSDTGMQSAGPVAPASQPEVNLGGADTMQVAPPTEQPAEPTPIPPPARHYGSALRPRRSNNPFANVTPFDLSARQPHSLAAGSIGHGLDLSSGPVVRNGRLQDAVAHTLGSHGLADYMDALRDFVESHKYYPASAAQNGEQGVATLQLTVRRDGTVKSLRLISSSGSTLLDAAWMSVFRDNRLPAFNDDLPMGELTLPVTLDYQLIYQH